MGYSVYWHVPQRICVVQAWGDIGLEELTGISAAVTDLIRSGDAPVHWIVDARKIASIPKSIGQIQKMAKVFQEPNLGWVLALSDNSFMKFATSLVSQLSHVKYMVFDEPADLLASIRKFDSSLPELPNYSGEKHTTRQND